MSFRSYSLALACLVSALPCVSAQPPADVDELQERAIKSAAAKAASSIVQIETSGGMDIIPARTPGAGGPQMRKGIGPTTGLVVASDGFVITSAFNFANKPQKIFVAVPGRKERYVAEVHATDHTRMLTLLKINAEGLSVPEPAPKKDFAIGQTAIALGRTLDPVLDHVPSISVGIISALNRIWGKAVQTDAKVSPANYGGPLVDLQGRVIGVLVPASPQADDETAGAEWYDGGIGFAIPLEDINAVLPRLKNKQDLRRGLLGVTTKGTDMYSGTPVVGAVASDSAAARVGIKPGDTILEIDGHTISRQAQVMHILGSKYDGDLVKVKVKHEDGKEETFENVRLTATLTAVTHAYLGILPMRDDPELGVEIRYVYRKGPADEAGLKAGDRLTKFGVGGGPLRPFTGVVSGRDQLQGILSVLEPGTEIQFEVKRKEGDKTETVKVRLGEIPETVKVKEGEQAPNPLAEKLPDNATVKKALEPRKTAVPARGQGARGQGAPAAPPKKDKDEDDKKPEKPEVGFFKRSNAAQDHEYWMYVPDSERDGYDPNISYALVVWLHPVGKGKETDMKAFKTFWEPYCDKYHIILACPKAENDTGWVASESDFIREVIKDVTGLYTIDKDRVVMHGMGIGGQMAFYVGFHARDLLRAVAVNGATLDSQAKADEAARPLSFFLVVGDKDPVAPGVKDSKAKLDAQKYPVIYREIANLGHQYLNDELADQTMEEFIRWIDSLDRM